MARSKLETINLKHMRSILLAWKQRDAQKAVHLWGVNVIRVIAVLWLVVHFTLTVLYVFPITSPQSPLQPLIDATIGRYFSQNWHLFAPTPTTADLILLVRPLTDNETLAVQTKGLPNDGWYDILSPLWAKYQNNRFSTYGRLSRLVVKNTLIHLNNSDDQQSIQILVEIASAFCKDIGKSNATYVALALHKVLSQPWAERGTSVSRVVQTTHLGMYPIDPSVENAHLYQL